VTGPAREREVARLRPWGKNGEKAGQPVPFDVMLCCYTLFERESSQTVRRARYANRAIRGSIG
jgi:hypothetical protein